MEYLEHLIAQQQVLVGWQQADLVPLRPWVVGLLGWLQRRLRLSAASLCLGIALLDRLLERNACARDHLRLLACACLLLASKYCDDDESATARAVVHLQAAHFDQAELCATELNVLAALDHRVGAPTALDFAHQLAPLANDDALRGAVERLLCVALANAATPQFAPLVVGLAALRHACALLDRAGLALSPLLAAVPSASCERHLARCLEAQQAAQAQQAARGRTAAAASQARDRSPVRRAPRRARRQPIACKL